MYAILDIETTGGQFNEEGITEIAIYKYDGQNIVDQFSSLINPEIPIQPFVVKLTGINNAMLRSAPKFYEVAKRIIEITNDCVLVAHNASFDYRILRTEFRRLGYDFRIKTLCTVELSQRLMPEQPSHSLGKLVRALGIPMADRHRASGDAMATVKLFKMLLEKDLEKTITKELIKFEVLQGVAPRLLDILDRLPSSCGIYYIHKEDGTIIFIGQSKNIKKRVNQHFTGITKTSKKIQTETFTVTFEETGSELIAQLKETEEIRKNRPVYNRFTRKKNLPWAIYSEKDQRGFLKLMLQRSDARKKEITAFASEQNGQDALIQICQNYQLCYMLNGLSSSKTPCVAHNEQTCDGHCLSEQSAEQYNSRVQEFIDKNSFDHKNMILIDQGRKTGERSAILIENGICKGYAFYDLNYQINQTDILRNILIPLQNSRETKNNIQNYLRKAKGIKIINF